ncbi:hypothetical protein FHS15_003761 [Paenibacillus castaneae]|uniref:hypothetical protein n=1 Tax=Paenibacillus castaneae TaxID=474957 RepID=UPI000C9B2CEA|nr:hypothetical protein [Paenibacillus castaneae]NIK78615.1 hypothetical protein [Paenibacillus castaneae]
MSKNTINKGITESEELDDLDQELRLLFKEFTVEYPSEDAIMQTIDTLRPYVKPPEESRALVLPFNRAMLQRLHIRPGFWLLNAIFFGFGLLAWGMWDADPYFIMLLLSPVPFLLGLLEVFRGRDEGLLELEMSCKYSAQQLMLFKMLVVGSYNLLLSMMLLAVFCSFGEPLLFTKIIMYWVTPFLVASSIGLAVANHVRSMVSMPITLTIWIGIASVITNDSEFTGKTNDFQLTLCAVASTLATLFFIYQAKRLRRGDYVEIIH